MSARRKTQPASEPRIGDGRHSLARLAPLPLDPAIVASIGVIRAATNAVRALPLHEATRAAARANGAQAITEHASAAGSLVRRTVTAYQTQQGKPTDEAAPF